MPRWMLVMGQVISYASALPVLLVTSYGALCLVHRSGIRWDVASGLLMLSLFGWSAGVIPAVIDGTIAVNRVMHNTQWVPGHFHFYLVLGLVSMVFGFMYFTVRHGSERKDGLIDRVAFWTFFVGGLGLCFTFLAAGAAGVPRRWAVHMPEWAGYDLAGGVYAGLIVFAVSIFVVRFLTGIRDAGSAEG